MRIELGEPAMIVAMLQHFFLPMKPKMGRDKVQNFSPFYSTLSPVKAAALLPS